MHKKILSISLIAILFLSIFIHTSVATDEMPWWNDKWSYNQEIQIPIDTSLEQAKYQPIDIKFEFNNTCWAKNEKEHSIRICLWDGNSWYELDSQIYDLEYNDSEHIKSCNIVFLIPPIADGNEKYYVYYDAEKKPGPDYRDYVDIGEGEYDLEPYPTIKIHSYFYKITQEDEIVYLVGYEGQGIEASMCHQINKLKDGSKDVSPKNSEQLVSFNFIYWYKEKGKNDNWKWAIPPIWTDQLVYRDVLVNGNLMVKFIISSESGDGRLRTTATYTYYYSPTEDKRIKVDVKDEVTKYPFPDTTEIDVSYIVMKSGGCRSKTRDDLNIECILPFLHVYEEEEVVSEYNINTCPVGTSDSDIVIDIAKQDDVDLGSKAWLSLDEGESGKAHAIIFNTTNLVKSGTNERQGIELQHIEGKSSIVPGSLELINSDFYIGRNLFEPGTEEPTDIPKDFVAEFTAEFFTTDDGGYKKVEQEAVLFQNLTNYQPPQDQIISNGDTKEAEKISLTAFTHLSPSLPQGSTISLLLKRNTTYTYAELYKEDGIQSSGSLVRMPLKIENIDYEGKNLTEILKTNKIRDIWSIFDWGNFTFFKKIVFENLLPGDYLIKIYRTNPYFGDKEPKFIGYKILKNLDDDTETHVFCSVEGSLNFHAEDQNGKGVEDANVQLVKEEMVVSEGFTDKDGNVNLKAPCNLKEKYDLRVLYKGFKVHQEEIQLGYLTSIKPLEKSLKIDLYDLTVQVFDSDLKPVEDNFNIVLTSEDMYVLKSIHPDFEKNGDYKFFNLIKSEYTADIRLNSFEIEEKISVPETDIKSINLYESVFKLEDRTGLPPGVSISAVVSSDDFRKTVVILGEEETPGTYVFKNLYQGDYVVRFTYKAFNVEKTVRMPQDADDPISIVFPAVFDTTLICYNNRGEILRNVDIVIKRDGYNNKVSVTNGNVKFTLPPAIYHCQVLYDGSVVAEQDLDISCSRGFEIVTQKEPIYPMLIIVVALIIFISLSGVLFWKKDKISVIEVLVVLLAIVGMMMPWWMIHGLSQENTIETTTNMYLIPGNMVSITSNGDILGGEISNLIDIFDYLIYFLITVIVIGCISILLGVLIKHLKKKNGSSFVASFIGFILLTSSVVGFTYGMSQLTKLGGGNFIGDGNLDIQIPGEDMYQSLSCIWGPTTGYILLLIASIIMFFVLIYRLKKLLKTWKKPRFQKKNIIKYFKKIMPAIGIIILIYIIFDLGAQDIAETFLKIEPIYILFSALLVIPHTLVAVTAWYYLMRKQKIYMSYVKTIKIHLIGFFYAVITPGYWGTMARLPYIKEETNEPIGKLFINHFIKTATTTFSMYIMMVIGTFLLVEKLPEALPIGLAVICGVSCVYLIFIKKERGEKIFYFLIKLLVFKKVKRIFTKFVDTFYTDFPRFRDLMVPFLLGFLIWIICYSQIYILAIPLGIQDHIPWLTFILLYPIGNIISFLPISTGGLGIREATFIFIFGLYGVSPETAVVISLAGHIVTDVLTGVYGLVIATYEARNSKKDIAEVKKLLGK